MSKDPSAPVQDTAEESSDAVLRAKINLETATIPWLELQRHFAAGRVVCVAKGLDLVEVAVELTRDNKVQFQQWIESGQVAGVTESQATRWYEEQRELWAVVVAPWVLVQDPVSTANH